MIAHNKIGFHTASGGNANGIGDWMKALDAADIPFCIKAADSMVGLFEAQEIVHARNGAIPHVLAFRRSVPAGSSRPPSGNPDVPDYTKEPEAAAAEHWAWHKRHLPQEIDPDLVWIETINELRKEVEWADWIGQFAYYNGQMAMADGYKFSAFGYSSGTPDEGAWETDGMLRYLESCQQNPDKLSVSLHEYSFKTEDIWFMRGDLIGRFEKLFHACDKHKIQRPKIIMTEWGWTHERVPSPDKAMQDIAEVAEYYAQFPEILGAAIWYLGPGFGGIANRAQRLIKPLTEYTLNNTFEIVEQSLVIGSPDGLAKGINPNARFIKDVTIPDDTVIEAGKSFTKTWLVNNNGDTFWDDSYQLVFAGGTPMTTVHTHSISETDTDENQEISIEMIAPTTPGTYYSDWRLQDDSGQQFGDIMYARIVSEAPVVQLGGTSNGAYVADLTIPDDTEIKAETAFTKTWRVRNTGNRAWGAGFTLAFAGGVPMTTSHSVPLPATAPGATADISINMTAPQHAGTHYGDWRLTDENGDAFGEIIYLRIAVPQEAGQSVVKRFSQRDSLWENKRLGQPGSTQTIGQWGCLLTCFTMTANVYGHAVTPAQLNDTLVRKGGFINVNWTKWNALTAAYTDIIYNGKVDNDPNVTSKIDRSLAQGHPVTILVDFTSNTPYTDNDQHWVLIVAKDGDDYRINDPWLKPAQETSLRQRYGIAGRPLRDSIRSAIFYKSTKTVVVPEPPEQPDQPEPVKLMERGMNVNPDAPDSNPYQTDDLKGLDWIRLVFKLSARPIESERDNIRKAFAQYDPIVRAYSRMGVKSLIIINQETYAPWDWRSDWETNPNWQGYADQLAQVARQIADHYKPYGDKVAYQIWNEGDKEHNPASVYLTPQRMGLVVRETAVSIRNISPASPIIFNGMATGPEATCVYVKQVEASLGGALPVDAIGIHPYGRWGTYAPFDWGKTKPTLAQAFEVYKRELPGKKFWITEIGVADDNELGSQYYADIGAYMKDVYKTVSDRYADLVPVLIWFAWSDFMRNAGVVKTDGNRKDHVYPAFRAVRNREL